MQRTSSILLLAGGVVAAGLGLGQSLASTGPSLVRASSLQDPVGQDPAPTPEEESGPEVGDRPRAGQEGGRLVLYRATVEDAAGRSFSLATLRFEVAR